MTDRDRFASDYNVNSDIMTKLDRYASLLVEWQDKMNLVARSTFDKIWSRHFADSAQIIGVVSGVVTSQSRWLDIGSGAGFPALVIALLAPGNFSLVEATTKKCRFLAHISEVIGVAGRVKIYNSRVENMAPVIADFITARACAPLIELFSLAERHGSGARWLALKGKTAEIEVAAAHAKFDFDYTLIPSRTASDAHIVDVTHVRRRRS